MVSQPLEEFLLGDLFALLRVQLLPHVVETLHVFKLSMVLNTFPLHDRRGQVHSDLYGSLLGRRGTSSRSIWGVASTTPSISIGVVSGSFNEFCLGQEVVHLLTVSPFVKIINSMAVLLIGEFSFVVYYWVNLFNFLILIVNLVRVGGK